jgi:hypothetical protein
MAILASRVTAVSRICRNLTSKPAHSPLSNGLRRLTFVAGGRFSAGGSNRSSFGAKDLTRPYGGQAHVVGE